MTDRLIVRRGYIIYRFYTDFSLFHQIKRQDTVMCLYIYNIQILYRFFSISPDKTSRYCDSTLQKEKDKPLTLGSLLPLRAQTKHPTVVHGPLNEKCKIWLHG